MRLASLSVPTDLRAPPRTTTLAVVNSAAAPGVLAPKEKVKTTDLASLKVVLQPLAVAAIVAVIVEATMIDLVSLRADLLRSAVAVIAALLEAMTTDPALPREALPRSLVVVMPPGAIRMMVAMVVPALVSAATMSAVTVEEVTVETAVVAVVDSVEATDLHADKTTTEVATVEPVLVVSEATTRHASDETCPLSSQIKYHRRQHNPFIC